MKYTRNPTECNTFYALISMSTNDRFVMNNVPLEYWSVMQRFANESKIYNMGNSEKQFKDFELTGLNNFDFFTSGSFEERCKEE